MADSILTSFDRDTLADFLAGYLYFKSKGRTNGDFVFFVMTKKFSKGIRIAIRIFAALIPGMIFDKAFRLVFLAAVMKSLEKRKRRTNSAKPKVD